MIDVESERLMNRVVTLPNGCMVHTNRPNAAGYGQVTIDGAYHYTHRLAYVLFVGPIPDGMEVDHKCRNKRCCNPDHLEAVTHAENSRRAMLGVAKSDWAAGDRTTLQEVK